MPDHDGPYKGISNRIVAGDTSDVLGDFREPRARVNVGAGQPNHVIHWLWGTARDGTFFVSQWTTTEQGEERKPHGNTAFFPTPWEAAKYAELMSQGHLSVGAVELLLDGRNKIARKAYRAGLKND